MMMKDNSDTASAPLFKLMIIIPIDGIAIHGTAGRLVMLASGTHHGSRRHRPAAEISNNILKFNLASAGAAGPARAVKLLKCRAEYRYFRPTRTSG